MSDTISFSSLEAGDLVLLAGAGSNAGIPSYVTSGFVLRQAAASEGGGAWIWPLTTPASPDLVSSGDWQVVAVIKSHRTASDDLGPYAGLADPA